jgi:preprotein translocase subunit SecD
MIKHHRKAGVTARIGTALLALALCAGTFTRASERTPGSGVPNNEERPSQHTPPADSTLPAQNKPPEREQASVEDPALARERAQLPFFQYRLVHDEPTADSEQLIYEKLDSRAGQEGPQRRVRSIVHVDRQPLLGQSAFRSARGLVPPAWEEAHLEIVLTADGAKRFEEVIGENQPCRVALILNGKVHSVAHVAGEIRGGGGKIRIKESSIEQARALAEKLNAAASEASAKR